MKAFVATAYGPPEVLRLAELEKPVPKDDEVSIRVVATGVNSADVRIRSLTMPTGFGVVARLIFGLTRPRQPVLGAELAGVVEAVGAKVTRFRAGDAVFGLCGTRMGAHAEYCCVRETGAIAAKPSSLSFVQAAGLSFGGTAALHFLRRGGLQPGEHVLVNGAAGSVGSAAVQLAKHFGAEVTGICSTGNLELVKSLGADHVIDYTQQDFARHRPRYDVVLDSIGTLSIRRVRAALAPRGRLLLVAASLPQMLATPWVALTSRQKLITGPAPERAEDLSFLAELVESRAFVPLIDRCYPFERLPEAHRYVGTGRKKGSVVVVVDPATAPLPDHDGNFPDHEGSSVQLRA
jgi:NADPH:quinone reductase-like Zn-dependent oxidoreductase